MCVANGVSDTQMGFQEKSTPTVWGRLMVLCVVAHVIW
jgi:hypothetical protein